jgi:hypothetical protein
MPFQVEAGGGPPFGVWPRGRYLPHLQNASKNNHMTPTPQPTIKDDTDAQLDRFFEYIAHANGLIKPPPVLKVYSPVKTPPKTN